jgi:hypothetical protein
MSLDAKKTSKKSLFFCSICFAKEKSSSIFARTFAKAEWRVNLKGFTV